MKKYILISSIFLLGFTQSCSESSLDLEANSVVNIEIPRTEEQLQMLLNGAYYNLGSTSGFGTELMIFGDLLGDNLFVSSTNANFVLTNNKNYNSNQGEFGFYGLMYNAIMKCNMIINDTNVASNINVERMKAEAKIVRALAYFTLVTYYSPSPTSGINQEYGIPIVLGNYDSLIQPKRNTVAEVYEQIISDLNAGINANVGTSLDKPNRSTLGKTAAKLLLSRVYLTRRAAGDAQLALQYSSDIVNNATPTDQNGYAPINASALTDPTKAFNATTNPYKFFTYFAGTDDSVSENQQETIWELDVNDLANQVTGIGSNVALPLYYHRTGDKRSLLFNQTFYNSFGTPPTTATQILNDDVRRGSSSAGLLISTGVPTTDTPRGFWTNKYPRLTSASAGSSQVALMRNIKVFRFAEAQLNEIEALYLTGQQALALTKLNEFALSRKGRTYTGANLLNDILTERAKEFYGEGQRFWDLKRYNLSITKPSNCNMNCDVKADDKLRVLPMTLGALNSNANLTQYPGYN
ncbi:RagB/SusD family nutrient uptake outer membrane protein [Epilithonimonas sp.]|uniref:RagB/SusD family nutrient uptake outer membrane protein n=1 Tax=Epilithonimonas sp. TaxID=2894511 RepID=UPI0028A1708A|nr:RagB/SusD family nutrient uptake outer membrane protein [Epilithonimonas sp.]